MAMLTRGRLARPLADGFIANGCEVNLVEYSSAAIEGYDYLLMYGPMAPIGPLVDRMKSTRNLPPIIFWYTEQMPDPRLPARLVRFMSRARFRSWTWYDGFLVNGAGRRLIRRLPLPDAGRLRGVGEIVELHRLGLLELICAFSQTNARILRRFDLPVAQIPIGYHPFFGEQLGLPRDIDVVFLGTTRDARRRKWIARLERELEKMGISLVIKDGSPRRGYLFDRERTLLLNRTKILLNVMRQAWDDAIYRFLLAAANGVVLLSEPLWSTSRGPLKPGTHYVECRLTEMAATVRDVLDSPSSRLSVAQHASGLIGSELTMSRMAGVCLQYLAGTHDELMSIRQQEDR